MEPPEGEDRNIVDEIEDVVGDGLSHLAAHITYLCSSVGEPGSRLISFCRSARVRIGSSHKGMAK